MMTVGAKWFALRTSVDYQDEMEEADCVADESRCLILTVA